MNILKSILPLSLLALAGGSALVSTSTGCDQQAVKCSSSHGDYVVQYTYVSGPESCKANVGERVGFQTYNAVGENGKPDLDRASIAIQADTVGSLQQNADTGGVDDPDQNDKPYSFGAFNTPEPVGDVCTVPTLSVAQEQLGAVAANKDAGVSAQPATLINYTWKNVQLYVTSQYYGSQFIADVAIGGQTATDCVYRARGLYPYVSCFVADAKGNPILDANGNQQVDESFCNPDPNPPTHPTGSGINPDFAVHCDKQLFACVPNSPSFPAFK